MVLGGGFKRRKYRLVVLEKKCVEREEEKTSWFVVWFWMRKGNRMRWERKFNDNDNRKREMFKKSKYEDKSLGVINYTQRCVFSRYNRHWQYTVFNAHWFMVYKFGRFRIPMGLTINTEPAHTSPFITNCSHSRPVEPNQLARKCLFFFPDLGGFGRVQIFCPPLVGSA